MSKDMEGIYCEAISLASYHLNMIIRKIDTTDVTTTIDSLELARDMLANAGKEAQVPPQTTERSFSMKCPKKPEEKIIHGDIETDTIISFGKCDGEECAWWDEANDQCDVLVMAWRLDSVASMLGVLTNEKSRLT